MNIKTVKKLFESQLKYEIFNQKAHFIVRNKDGTKEVLRIPLWELGGLVNEYDYKSEFQKGHILPVLVKVKL